jgi:peroxiredoxin
MKIFWIGLSAGLALASAGTLLYTQSLRPHVSSPEILEGLPKHPVTDEMLLATDAKSQKLAPAFSVRDTKGRTVTIAPPVADKPQFVYFVLDGCPCSFESEPLFQDLYRQFDGQVEFVAVTNADEKKAAQWQTQMSVPYPVVADPQLEIVRAYEAINSVYSALIDRDGAIVKMWPGYSKDILLEINDLMADAAGIEAKPFDTKYAPLEKSSGCKF